MKNLSYLAVFILGLGLFVAVPARADDESSDSGTTPSTSDNSSSSSGSSTEAPSAGFLDNILKDPPPTPGPAITTGVRG